jgi:manganese transport protein
MASLINISMLVLAAALLRNGAASDPILLAHQDLGRMVGGGAALAFAVALLASGLSSPASAPTPDRS